MIDKSIITTIFNKIINARTVKELKLVKVMIEEDCTSNPYNPTDIMILYLALEFRAYTLVGKDMEEAKSEDKDLNDLYESEINTVNKKSLIRVKKLFRR